MKNLTDSEGLVELILTESNKLFGFFDELGLYVTGNTVIFRGETYIIKDKMKNTCYVSLVDKK